MKYIRVLSEEDINYRGDINSLVSKFVLRSPISKKFYLILNI